MCMNSVISFMDVFFTLCSQPRINNWFCLQIWYCHLSCHLFFCGPLLVGLYHVTHRYFFCLLFSSVILAFYRPPLASYFLPLLLSLLPLASKPMAFEKGNYSFLNLTIDVLFFPWICVICFWCVKKLWKTFILIVTRSFIFRDRKLISRRMCTVG